MSATRLYDAQFTHWYETVSASKDWIGNKVENEVAGSPEDLELLYAHYWFLKIMPARKSLPAIRWECFVAALEEIGTIARAILDAPAPSASTPAKPKNRPKVIRFAARAKQMRCRAKATA